MKRKKKLIYPIKLGDEVLSYTLSLRSNLRKYSFKLDYDLIQVLAPKGVTPEKAATFLKRNSQLILSEINKNRKLPLYQFVDGEIFLFLGEKYTLNVVESAVSKVEIAGDKLVLYTKDILDAKRKAKAVSDFFRDNARQLFSQLTNNICKRLDMKMPNIKLYYAKSTFGKCYFNDDRIDLNYYIIFAPVECIEYVIVHELAHFQVHSHLKGFWDVVAKSAPNYKQLRKNLNQVCNRNFCNIVGRFFYND